MKLKIIMWLILVLIDDLESINYTVNKSANITTEIQENIGKEKLEIKDVTVKRSDFDSDDVTILELKDFLSK